jgi:hypothetical protein
MGKRRINQIAGRDPWEVEADYWVKWIKEYREDLPDPMISVTARSLVISLWMAQGDLRPLAAAIRSHLRNLKGSGPKVHGLDHTFIGGLGVDGRKSASPAWGLVDAVPEQEVLHPRVLELLAGMIEKRELSVKRGRRGNRQQAIFARDVLMFDLYEQAKKSRKKSADGRTVRKEKIADRRAMAPEEEVAKRLGMKPEAVHQALIKVRKARGKGLARWTGKVK